MSRAAMDDTDIADNDTSVVAVKEMSFRYQKLLIKYLSLFNFQWTIC